MTFVQSLTLIVPALFAGLTLGVLLGLRLAKWAGDIVEEATANAKARRMIPGKPLKTSWRHWLWTW